MNTSLPQGDESGITTVGTAATKQRPRWLREVAGLFVGILILLALYGVLSVAGVYHADSHDLNYCDGASYNCGSR